MARKLAEAEIDMMLAEFHMSEFAKFAIKKWLMEFTD